MPNKEGNWKEYILRGTVPANSSNTVLVKDLDGSTMLKCRQIRGTFTTLQDDGAGASVDYGVTGLEFRIVEGGNDYQFMDNYVPADMMLSPGRRRDARATNNDTAPGINPIFEPLPFHHDFKNRIEVPVVNKSDRDQFFEIGFIGYECRK
jgi:hypothetical protein